MYKTAIKWWLHDLIPVRTYLVDQLSIACKSSWADFNYNGLGYNLNHSLWCRQLAINFHKNLKYLIIRFGKRFWDSKGRPWFPNFPNVQNTLLSYEIMLSYAYVWLLWALAEDFASDGGRSWWAWGVSSSDLILEELKLALMPKKSF